MYTFVVPHPGNSSHQEPYVFSRGSLWTFIYQERDHPNVNMSPHLIFCNLEDDHLKSKVNDRFHWLSSSDSVPGRVVDPYRQAHAGQTLRVSKVVLEEDAFLLEQPWKWSMFWRQATIFHKSISNGECWEMKGTDLCIGEVWHALLPIHSNGLGLRAKLEVLGPIGVDSWDVHTTRTCFYFQNIFVLNCTLYVHVLDTWYIMSMHRIHIYI